MSQVIMFFVRFLQIGPLQAAFFVHYLQKTHNISTPQPDTLLSITPGIIVEDHGTYEIFMEDEYPHIHAYARYCTVSITAVQVVIT